MSDPVEMYVNHVDLRKITYRFTGMTQYALECKKNLLNLLKSFIPDISTGTSTIFSVKTLKSCVSLCCDIYLIKTRLRVSEFLKIDKQKCCVCSLEKMCLHNINSK